MKKFITIFMLLIIGLLISACGAKPNLYFQEKEISLIVGETKTIEASLENSSAEITYLVPENAIVSLDGNTLTALSEGTISITAKIEDKNVYTASLKVNVLPIPAESIEITGNQKMLVGGTQVLSYNILPTDLANKNVNWSSSNDQVATVSSNGTVNALSAGTVTIAATSVTTQTISKTIEITVYAKDETKPVLSFENSSGEVTYNIGDEIDYLKDVKAIDDINGDITNNIQYDSDVNLYKEGTYHVTYKVKDASNNEADTITRTYKLVYNSYVKFIGHAGCYYGIMNSEEAYINAGKRGYQFAECDLKQTSDGVFVLSHDDSFNGTAIASTTYANLKKVTYTATRGGVSYTTNICTLERYLEICKEYGMTALIELKSSNGITNSNQSRMAALMAEISKANMLDQVAFLGSQYNCLIWVKQNGYENIPCQYLVNSCESEDILERCNTYNLDLSFNIENSNSDEWLARYTECGHKISCWTFSQYSTVETLQKWIDTGYVDYVTCDVLTCLDVNLPVNKNVTEKTKYPVNFVDYDGKLIKASYAYEGMTAVSPVDPKRDGYTFTGWDVSYKNVTSELTVTATYTINNYSISYYANNTQIEEITFESKEAFITEFYTDLYNWLTSNVDKISELTYNGSVYTLIKNGVTVTFASVNDIRQEDIYNFEKTYSNYIYKPVKRATNTTAVTPEEDENYFLNSSLYRAKWINMDQFFLYALVNRYTSYDRTYTPTSLGKVQIMFRFHQWQKGTNIQEFNTLPTCFKEGNALFDVTMPTTINSYTVEEEIVLPTPSSTTKTFKCWNTKADGTGETITKISKGTYGNISLYAIWE